MTVPRILIAGIGNIFFADDAFGVEVVRRLADNQLALNVSVRDFGIRGFDLAYALLDGYDGVILVDAFYRGGKPGTLYVMEPDVDLSDDGNSDGAWLQTHNLDPLKVIRLAKTMSDRLPRILVLGCEPANVDFDEAGSMTLSEPVDRAVLEATAMMPCLLERLQSPNREMVS